MSIDTAKLRALIAGATPGEWHVVGPPWRPRDCGTYIIAGHIDPHAGTPVVGSIEIDEWPTANGGPDYSQSDRDLACVAALHNSAPALLDEIDTLRAEVERLRKAATAVSIKAVGRSGGSVYLIPKDIFLALRTALKQPAEGAKA